MLSEADKRLILRPELPVPTIQSARGAGRLLNGAYSSLGTSLGDHVGRLSHTLGFGPEAAAMRIEKVFETSRQSILDEIHATFKTRTPDDLPRRVHTLKKRCMKLIEYAQP